MVAVCCGDEAQFVDGGDEGAEEKEVEGCYEEGGAFGCVQAD